MSQMNLCVLVNNEHQRLETETKGEFEMSVGEKIIKELPAVWIELNAPVNGQKEVAK